MQIGLRYIDVFALKLMDCVGQCSILMENTSADASLHRFSITLNVVEAFIESILTEVKTWSSIEA